MRGMERNGRRITSIFFSGRIHFKKVEATQIRPKKNSSSAHAIHAPTVEDEHTSKADACGAACHATKKAHSTDYKRKCSIDFFGQPDSHKNLTVIAWLKMQTSRICVKHLRFYQDYYVRASIIELKHEMSANENYRPERSRINFMELI